MVTRVTEGESRTGCGEDPMLQTVLVSTLRVGVATTNEVAQIVVDNTLGRFLDTNPHKVR